MAVLFGREDGRPPLPGTITRRFKKLAAAGRLPEIDLHDVRHSHPTAGCDAKIDWKTLSWDGPRGGVSEASSPIAAYLVFWQAGPVAGFDELVTEALTAPFSGWDFSWLDRRSWTEPLPWDYSARVAALARRARTMLDMGTGGGEALSGLPDRAPRTIATEAWPPNVPVAGRRLLPLGIPVIQDEAARDNMDQNEANDGGRLPFRDGSLDLICNRHESFLALEVSRVLAPGGTFVTQQVDYHDNDDLAQILGIETPQEPDSWIGLAERQVTEAGLVIEEAARAGQRIRFDDIAAVIFYLKAVSWSIPGYSLEKYRDRLRALYEDASAWPVVTSGYRFLLVASKPG